MDKNTILTTILTTIALLVSTPAASAPAGPTVKTKGACKIDQSGNVKCPSEPPPPPPPCSPCLYSCYNDACNGSPPGSPTGDMWRIVEAHDGACELENDADGLSGRCGGYLWHCDWGGACEDSEGLSWTDTPDVAFGLCEYSGGSSGCNYQCGPVSVTCSSGPISGGNSPPASLCTIYTSAGRLGSPFLLPFDVCF